MASINPAELLAAIKRMMAETKWTKISNAGARETFDEGRRIYRMAQGSTDQDQLMYEHLMHQVDENPYGRQIRASEPIPGSQYGDPGLPRQTQNYLQNRMFAGPKGALPAALIAALLRAQQTSRPSSAPADATGY